jgi:hypothetical protein
VARDDGRWTREDRFARKMDDCSWWSKTRGQRLEA